MKIKVNGKDGDYHKFLAVNSDDIHQLRKTILRCAPDNALSYVILSVRWVDSMTYARVEYYTGLNEGDFRMEEVVL